MKVYVESKDQLIEKRADSREWVTLGSEYANKEVQELGEAAHDRND